MITEVKADILDLINKSSENKALNVLVQTMQKVIKKLFNLWSKKSLKTMN